jgi:hypothetical protein
MTGRRIGKIGVERKWYGTFYLSGAVPTDAFVVDGADLGFLGCGEGEWV